MIFCLYSFNFAHIEALMTNKRLDKRLDKSYRVGKIKINSKTYITTLNLFFDEEHSKGMSGLKRSNLPNNFGLLFIYLETAHRQFWMPNTFFNLDIIFLDKFFKIIHTELNVLAHPGTKNTPPIARTKKINAKYVLEIPTDLKLSKYLKVGKKLNWTGSNSLSEIESKIRSLK